MNFLQNCWYELIALGFGCITYSVVAVIAILRYRRTRNNYYSDQPFEMFMTLGGGLVGAVIAGLLWIIAIPALLCIGVAMKFTDFKISELWAEKEKTETETGGWR